MKTTTQANAPSTTTHSTLAKNRQPTVVAPQVAGIEASVLDMQQENGTRLGHSFGAISVFAPDPPIQPKRANSIVNRLTAFNSPNTGKAGSIPGLPASWTVRPLIQAKLTVGQPNDQYEQEADRVADQVMRMAEPRVQAKCACGGEAGPDGECAACKAKRLEAQSSVQTKEEDEEGVVQTKADANPVDATPDLESRLNGSRGNGSALPDETRSSMESAFGVDFGGVRVHTGSDAVQMNRELSAQAFTHGSDIYFNSGKYEPGSAEGKGLLAHELTHVVQQNSADSTHIIHRQPKVVDPDPSQIEIFQLLRTKASEKENFETLKKIDPGIKRLLIMTGGILRVYDESHKLLKSFIISTSISLPAYYYYIDNWLFYPIAVDGNGNVVAKGAIKPKSEKEKKEKEQLDKLFTPSNWFASNTIVDEFYKIMGDEQASLAVAPVISKSIYNPPGKEELSLNLDLPAWFNELKLKVEALIAKERQNNKSNPLLPEKIFFYGSNKVQVQKGDDAWTIEVEKEKRKAYLTIQKVSWDATSDKDKFANDTTEQLYRKVKLIIDENELNRQEEKEITEIDSTGKKNNRWAWAVKLKKQIERLLTEQKSAAPSAIDFPDKLTLTTQGEGDNKSIYLRVSVYRTNSTTQPNAKPELSSGILPTALRQDDRAEDWVPIVRKLSAAIKSRQVTTNPLDVTQETKKPSEASDPNAPKGNETILPPYPAKIYAPDINPDHTTATVASNTFRMVLDFAAIHGDNLLNLTTIRMGMDIAYAWSIYPLPDALRTLKNNKELTQEMLLKQTDDYVKENKRNLGEATKTYDADFDWEQSIKMSGMGTGDFLLVGYAGVRYPDEWNIKRATSVAPFPFTVKTAEELARESAYAESDAIETLKAQLTHEKDADKAAKLEQQIKELEGRDKEDLLTRTSQDINETKELLETAEALKRYIQDDRRRKIPFSGDATHDPFLLRLKAFDKKMYAVYLLMRQLFDSRRYDDLDAVAEYIKILTQQKADLDRLQKRTQSATRNSKLQKSSPLYRTISALVKNEDGNVVPITLMIGRHEDTVVDKDDSSKNKYKMILFDVTFDSPKKDDMTYVGGEESTEEAAIESVFEEFGETNKYGEGKIVYRVPQLGIKGSADSVTTWYEYLEYALAAIGIGLLVAGAVISGGTLAPASAAAIGGVVSALGIATAVAGAAFAARNIYKRVEKGTFELDASFALDIVSIIGAYVQVVGSAGKVITMSRGIGAAAKAMQIQRLNKLLYLYDATELGGNVVLVSLKVQEDVEAVKRLNLPKDQADELMQQIAMEAVQTGAMLAYASISKIKDVSDHISASIENSRYKTLANKRWIDADGKPTDQAPPFLKNQKIEPGKLPDRAQQGESAWKEVQVLPLGRHPSTEAGHEFTVTERGRIIRCSDFCSDLRMKYGKVLGLDPTLNKEMTGLEARAKSAADAKDKVAADLVAKDAATFETKLHEADQLRQHLLGASEQEWNDALESITAPHVTGGDKSGRRIDGVKIPTRQRRLIDVADIMTDAEIKELGTGGYRKAMDRIGNVMGKKISDIPELRTHWDKVREEVMAGKSAEQLGRDKMITLYKSAQQKFWNKVRNDSTAVEFLKKYGFVFEGQSGAALAELGPRGKQSTERGRITDQERRISLDHIAEKAQGDNWEKALDADNLELMFQNANSWKEIVQVKFGMRDTEN